jgi:FtsP/CotA-like multicopper oxidase with cupredoxin domain
VRLRLAPRYFVIVASAIWCLHGPAQSRDAGDTEAQVLDNCTRPQQGSTVADPAALRSKNGRLSVFLKIRNLPDADGTMRYCYLDEQGHVAPTLRLGPGDEFSLTLKNELSVPVSSNQPSHASNHGKTGNAFNGKHDPCSGGPMTAASTNLHFHGLSVPPVCHQDETLKTMIEPGDAPFTYRIRIPKTQPPGLYWYHPHVHGFGEEQILGGASGALIVEGMESAVPRVAGLPERIFVIRDHKMPAPRLRTNDP